MPRGPATTSRAVLTIAVVLSAVVHAGLLAALVVVRLDGPRTPLVDAPTTTIVLGPAASKPAPPPSPPAPEPKHEPAPVPAPEPAPDPAPPTPITPPAPTPTAMVIEPAIPAPPPIATPAAIPAPPEPPPAAYQASFAGMKGERARRIVYVVDGSAAMITTMPYLRAELARSIAGLSPSQSFEVVVFRQPPPAATSASMIETFSGLGLVAASTTSKNAAAAWARRVQPSGSSVPLVGLTRALEMKPDLVFLLTCSIPRSAAGQWGDGTAVTMGELDRLNPVQAFSGRRATVIKAVQLLKQDPTGLLQAIADTHGDGPGSYRVLGLDELGGR